VLDTYCVGYLLCWILIVLDTYCVGYLLTNPSLNIELLNTACKYLEENCCCDAIYSRRCSVTRRVPSKHAAL